MNRKLERIFRDRSVTTAEVAHDEEVRRAVQAEFPPANTSHEARTDSLGEALRKAIRGSPYRWLTSPKKPTCQRWPCQNSSPVNETSICKPPNDWSRPLESNSPPIAPTSPTSNRPSTRCELHNENVPLAVALDRQWISTM